MEFLSILVGTIIGNFLAPYVIAFFTKNTKKEV